MFATGSLAIVFMAPSILTANVFSLSGDTYKAGAQQLSMMIANVKIRGFSCGTGLVLRLVAVKLEPFVELSQLISSLVCA